MAAKRLTKSNRLQETLLKAIRRRDGKNDQPFPSVRQIARELKLNRKTVRKWVKRESFQKAPLPQRASKLDPFKAEIVRLLERHEYSAQQILQQIREHGYEGRYTIVKAFVRQVRPRRQPAFLTLHFAPGECAQVDWGYAGSVPVGATQRRLSFFVMVLAFSRKMYLEFTLAETLEHFLACHQHAFEYFGGVVDQVWKHYVPRNIIGILFPTRICGRAA